MKTGIIGLPRVGKTALFHMLTGAAGAAGRRMEALGIAAVPDSRLDRLTALYQPKKHTPATIELADLASLTEASLRDGAGIAALRPVDALLHVLRAFSDPGVSHELGSIDPLRDAARIDFDLVVSDLGQVEKRRERLAKEIKKQPSPQLRQEAELLARLEAHLNEEQPLRSLPLAAEEEKLLRGFQFLSQKPLLYVLNTSEAEAGEWATAVARHGLETRAAAPRTAALALCVPIEAEIATLPAADAAAFLTSYGLPEPGLARLARSVYQLLGLISFFTAGADECRAWTLPAGAPAVAAAGAIHSDLAQRFIRAEVIRWDRLLELGSEAAARGQGLLRSEGKDYIVQDGDVLHIRHGA